MVVGFAHARRSIAGLGRYARSDSAGIAAARGQPRPAIEPARIGRFTVARNLGRGGQGCVYEGFDAQLERRVALKIPRFAHGADLAFEARALARVRHPNLVTVYALEICEGRPVVVMELVEGTPLLAWIADTRPSSRRIVDGWTSWSCTCSTYEVSCPDDPFVSQIIFGTDACGTSEADALAIVQAACEQGDGSCTVGAGSCDCECTDEGTTCGPMQ